MNDSIGYYRDLLIEGDFVIKAAEAYSIIKRESIRSKLTKYERLSVAKGEFTNSVLGSMIVGTVTFVFNMVINCIKYLLMAIKSLIFDSQLIPGIINGVMGIMESSSYFKKVKITDLKDTRNKLEAIEKVLERRIEKIDKNKNKPSVYDLIDDGMISIGKVASLKYMSRNAINDKELDKYISNMRKEYSNINKINDSKSMKFNKNLYISTTEERSMYLVKFKDLLIYLKEYIYDQYILYLQKVSTILKNLEKQLEKLKKNPDNATYDERIMIRISETFLPLFVVDIKNMSEGIDKIKREILADMLAMTEDLK